MMTRAAIASLIFAFAAPALPAAGQDIPDVEAGVSLFWVSHYDSYDSSYRERIVAAGEDWAIYESLMDDGMAEPGTSGPGDFFVLFSGIDYRSCSEDQMPDTDERARLSALFPLTEGSVMEESSYSGNPVIRVGAAQDFFLMGETRTANEVLIDYPESEADAEDEKLIVLADIPYTVALDWGESGKDRVTLIAQSDETQDVPAPEQLGNCAALLN
ncbi:MAG TPA: hypothetical protein EYG02_03900 [Henriciella marina]|uniref:hypothetical protein n=1 Tax=Henriciella sp. TaxID=1968823 RepID=UPI001850F7D2|nr:hypothetical protein [Henriciella sp.]HIG23320.1 hypothetical protein [Henriciella sp.]HIK64157.1 hypothetical protein [Henriciella marina]